VAPAIVLDVKFKVWNSQSGALLPATGVAGIGLTVTVVVPAGPLQPATLTDTV
jgi:hypothetical protein